MNFNVQSGASNGSLRYQSSHEPPVWLEVLVDVSRRGFVQLAVTLISLLWIVVTLGRNHLRGQSSKVKAYKPRGILVYECLGQLLRAATLALFIVASSRASRQWPNAVATGYVFILGILRITAQGTFRQVLLRHINTISLCTFLLVGFAEILPLLVVASTYRPGAVTVAAFVALSCYLLVAGMSPREWFPPKEGLELPDGTKAEPAKEETCSIFDYYSTFSRVDTLIRKGFKGSITMNEMDKVPSHFNPEVLRRKFSTLRAKHKTTARTMFFLLWPQIIFSIVIGILMGLAELFAPFSLYRILDYLGAPEDAIFKPAVWLVVMFGGRMVHTLLNQAYAVTTRKLAIYVKLMLTADIYQVALASHELEGNFSKAADNKEEAEHEASTSAIGILENMISTDINSIMMLRVFLMAITTMPSAIFAVAGLYAIVGWPCFVGLGLMVVGSPLASLISKYITIYQEKLKVAQDSRISLASEYLRSVKVIKYFGWEDSVVKLIGEARAGEQKHIWTVDMLYFWMMEISACIPIVSLLSIFALFVGVEKKILTASVAYTTITLLNLVRDDFMFLAGMWLDLPKAIVSFRRLDSFFSAATPLETYPHGPVQVKEATFRRSATADFRLYDLSIDFAQNGLNVVTGVSGSGKTTLLLALLGETVKEAGHVVRQKDAAFASQSSWLQSTTIRDNIIFNSMDDPERYKSVVQACCLDMDFAELPKGDQTEVGENGSALSGGQRARVALARALYSWSSLLLLDDIFSALDTKTSLELWNRVFCSDIIKHRTVILVTQLSWIMQEADVAITLDNGRVKSMEQNIGHVRTPKIARGDVEEADEPASDDTKDRTLDVNTEPTNTTEDGQAEAEGAGLTVVDEEVASTGVLGGFAFVPYLFYFGGPVVVTLTLSTLFIHTGVNVLTNYWMSLWVDKADSYAQTTFYLSVYIGLSFASEGVDALAVWTFLRGGWVAAKTLHERMIKSLFDVSLNWYTANPVGRVINRLSGDVENLDQQISMPLFYVLMTIVKAFMMLGAVTTVLPGFIVPVIVLSIIGIIIGAVYNRTAVFLRQLVSSSQSPILSDFSEGLSGMMVVRATRSTQTIFTNKMSHLLYASAQANAGQIEADQWLKFRMNTLASAINAVAALLAILQSSRLSAGIVGFCLSQATQMSEMILYLVFNISEVNIQMQTFHRVREYTRLPPEEEKKENTGKTSQIEDDSDEAEYPTPTNWPKSGTVEFRDVTVRYSLDGPDILKKVNLRFNAGERVAVVGRTGSGKSTLVLSILRFTNIVSGQILYDGVDVTHVPRKQLRQAVSTIPQEAQLFQGTLAANLDPTGTIPESHLQKTLEVCQSLAAMKRDTQATTTAEDGSNVNFSERLALTTKVKARGENFSHGQRQVLSLCRVLARRSKLVLLDEATSSMDAETDAGVQKALSDEFSSSDGNKRCLITIAHRLQTIADYDKVVVMSSGEVVEVGSPRDLMEKKGAFYDMVMHDREEDSIAVVNQ